MLWFAVAYYVLYAVGVAAFFGIISARERKHDTESDDPEDAFGVLDFFAIVVLALVWPALMVVVLVWWLIAKWLRWMNRRG